MTDGFGNVGVIIVAAGKGLRFGGDQKKQYRYLGNRPVLAHALTAFDVCDPVKEIFLVVSDDDRDLCRKEVLDPFTFRKPIHLISGGKKRQESVYKGLEATQGRFEVVLIHDGVRPFVTTDMILACLEQARQSGASIVAEGISDTVKRVDGIERVVSTLDRSSLRLAQTPQAFDYELIRNAHVTAAREGYQGTDDAQLVERLGTTVMTVPGSRTNIKITTSEDLEFANVLLGNLSLRPKGSGENST